jgi:hypothetical protein
MNVGYFLGVFARLKQKNDVSHACLRSLDDRLALIESRIANNIGMRCAFNSHEGKLLSSLTVSVVQKFIIVNYYATKSGSDDFSWLLVSVEGLLETCYPHPGLRIFRKSLTVSKLQGTINAMKGGGV